MTTDEIAATGYAIAAALFLLLTVLLLGHWRDRSNSPVIVLASLVSAFWAVAICVVTLGTLPWIELAIVANLGRSAVWILALVLVLQGFDRPARIDARIVSFAVGLPIAAVVLVFAIRLLDADAAMLQVQTIGGLVFATSAVVLCEQVYRNASQDMHSGVKYFCLAIAGMFLYDVALFGWAIIDGEISKRMWLARGYVNGMFVVPLGYALSRRIRFAPDSLLPRQIMFYSFALTVIGGFLLLLFSADYYLKNVGGDWSEVLRILGLVSALAFAAALLISPLMRARARVLFMKALFQYKYDYRREWLRFIATLSEAGREQVPVTAARAIAQIVNSPGGVVWAQHDHGGDYVPVAAWQCQIPAQTVRRDSSLVSFLSERQWIVDINEMKTHPSRYEGLSLGNLVDDGEEWWLVVPMLLGKRLSGFVVLLQPHVVPMLNFEDHDLLKTVGRHVATHIEQAESDRRLAEASQFGAYNRLTAFLMHDLNNLIAQQSLVVKNAERFRDNADFVDDAINTIAHSVARMRRLMGQLASSSKPPAKRRVNVCQVVQSAVERNLDREPIPTVDADDQSLVVLADAERLSMVIEHLVRNAQEATAATGSVGASVQLDGDRIRITISDTGCGMTQQFIRDRLFRPFDSTKGSQSMGIGAYQARDYADSLGGRLEVTSRVGEGTVFTLWLPRDTAPHST